GTFLKGLYDWRTEETMLCSLDRNLKDEFGKGFSIIGTPRYKGKTFRAIASYTQSDHEYMLNVALNLLIYNGVIWLQTREPWELNKNMIDTFGGGFIFTLDCSTAPGGYAEKPKGHQQFPVHLYRPGMITSKLNEKGIELVYGWGKKELEEMQKNL
ncbi:MAG: hypothetical protein NT001_02605, partial [Candidatus Woesearchaeota archaeon]|nr:hypothetical protein [Candidatus Woesearchaeota archaeon]